MWVSWGPVEIRMTSDEAGDEGVRWLLGQRAPRRRRGGADEPLSLRNSIATGGRVK